MASGLEAPRGLLYVVGTPIGNLEDISLRALRILREVALVAAEDTRHTRVLLAHYGITTPLISYREQNKASVTPIITDRLHHDSVALVCDAGLPAIADPGADLIARVLGLGGRVEVVPGANAALTALIGSGLSPAPFTFAGFLSRQRGARRRHLAALASRSETLVFYEAPHRLRETLADMLAAFGDRQAAVARELTKHHEETVRDTLSALAERFSAVTPRGEITIVVHGMETTGPAAPDAMTGDVDADLRAAMRSGEDMRAAVVRIAVLSDQTRRSVYARWQALRGADAWNGEKGP